MGRTFNRQWHKISILSQDRNKSSRITALAKAAIKLDKAVLASGIEKVGGESLLERITKCIKSSEHWPTFEDIKAAIESKNAAVHSNSVPDADKCTQHLHTFYNAWLALRSRFVTQENAASLAREFFETGIFSDIFLFGSLARGKNDSSDIDLLLLDDGTYSFLSVDYLDLQTTIFEVLMNIPFKKNQKILAAAQCGWLDCIILNDALIGVDQEYTDLVCIKQRDPNFFQSLASCLLHYDQISGSWIKDEKSSARFENIRLSSNFSRRRPYRFY